MRSRAEILSGASDFRLGRLADHLDRPAGRPDHPAGHLLATLTRLLCLLLVALTTLTTLATLLSALVLLLLIAMSISFRVCSDR